MARLWEDKRTPSLARELCERHWLAHRHGAGHDDAGGRNVIARNERDLAGAVGMVIPMLVCRDGASEIDFCKAAFGAQELSRRAAPDGSVVHATLTIGAAMVMVHGEIPHLASRAPQVDGSSPVVIYLYVDDVDSVIERAENAGAKILIPAADQFWGDRVGRILDTSGHVWNVASRARESRSDPTGGAVGQDRR